jgi:hypothetical protein
VPLPACPPEWETRLNEPTRALENFIKTISSSFYSIRPRTSDQQPTSTIADFSPLSGQFKNEKARKIGLMSFTDFLPILMPAMLACKTIIFFKKDQTRKIPSADITRHR